MTDTVTRAGMEHIVPFDPYSYDFHGSVPHLRPAAPRRRNTTTPPRISGHSRDMRTCGTHFVTPSGCPTAGCVDGPVVVRTQCTPGDVVPGDGRSQTHAHPQARVQGIHPAPGQRTRRTHRELTAQHWQVCLDKGEFDYVSDFAGLLPMDVVSELLGVPESDRAHLRAQSDALVHRDEGVLDVPSLPCTRISNCTATTPN